MCDFMFFLLLFPVVSTLVIDCTFKTENYYVVGDVYKCELNQNPLITSPGMVITEATGTHYDSTMNHESVKALYYGSRSHTINYIPRGLTNVFPHLIAIYIVEGRVKEITQDDLKEYTKLQLIWIQNGDITYLEKDLFKFNPELRRIGLNFNKIKQVHPTAFDNLNQLEWLGLIDNVCVTEEVKTKTKVLELIKKIKDQCPIDFIIRDLYNITNDQKNQIDENAAQIEIIGKNLATQIEKLEATYDEKTNQFALNISNITKDIKIAVEDNKIAVEDNKMHLQENSRKTGKLETEIENIGKNLTIQIKNLEAVQDEKSNQLAFKQSNITENLKTGLNTKNDEIKALMMETAEATNESIKVFYFLTLPSVCVLIVLTGIVVYLCLNIMNKKKNQMKEENLQFHDFENYKL